MPPTNRAAFLTAAKAYPLTISAAPYPTPGPNELLIRNHAVAINPVDWGIQSLAIFPITYPAIIGFDVAGTVVEVGSSIDPAQFKVGDRVLGHAHGLRVQRQECAGFQEYTVLVGNTMAKIPDGMKFEEAAVLPLCLSTAATGLFLESHLGLDLPKVGVERGSKGKAVLVWGGASSVGCNVVQLAVAAGYEVVVTASEANFELMKKLGASQVFDYKKDNVVDELVEALRSKEFAGVYDAIGFHGAIQNCVEIASRLDGKKMVVTAQHVPEDLSHDGIGVEFVVGDSTRDDDIGKAVYVDFLPEALAEGSFLPAPEPEVVGHGLEHIQAAIDTWKKGVSAKKIVVTL
ncbi:MAG: hypothetical protein M1820_010672 [Bogoriella megaspora]|nr:MAG: hypothetical protein M1820_010672 [Bogoriella megaspora]